MSSSSSLSSAASRPLLCFTGTPPVQLGGPCALCGEVHTLDNDAGPALQALAAWFDALTTPTTPADRAFVALLEKAGGRKMVATLAGRDRLGDAVILRAFSGDLAGISDVEGCVPSIIRREDTAALEAETLRVVAAATDRMNACSGAVRDEARRHRKAASSTLMAAMISATHLHTRGGRRVHLREAFLGASSGRGIPSGTADCALPKLLDAAFAAGVEVVGVAEASWAPAFAAGGAASERSHGVIAAPCEIRCAPILGAMLCPLRSS